MPLIFYQSCNTTNFRQIQLSLILESKILNQITSEFISGRLFDHVLGNKNRPRDLDVHFKPTQGMQNIFTK